MISSVLLQCQKTLSTRWVPFCQAQAQPQLSWPGLALFSLCTLNFQILSLNSTRESIFLDHFAMDLIQIFSKVVICVYIHN